MSDSKDIQRANAEARFVRAQERATDGAQAKIEHDASIIARDVNTKRLKALRLEKERADRESAAAAPPSSRRQGRG